MSDRGQDIGPHVFDLGEHVDLFRSARKGHPQESRTERSREVVTVLVCSLHDAGQAEPRQLVEQRLGGPFIDGCAGGRESNRQVRRCHVVVDERKGGNRQG